MISNIQIFNIGQRPMYCMLCIPNDNTRITDAKVPEMSLKQNFKYYINMTKDE